MRQERALGLMEGPSVKFLPTCAIFGSGFQTEAELKRIFRFRSAERDLKTDQLRIDPLVQAIESAATSAAEEREALCVRIGNARDRASLATGTGDDEYMTRDVKDALQITEYERQISIGESRLRVLDQQINCLTAMKDLSRKLLADVA